MKRNQPSLSLTEFLQELAFCEHRFVLIAEAMPPDRYPWRPTQEMCSFGGILTRVVITTTTRSLRNQYREGSCNDFTVRKGEVRFSGQS